ncbi:hypothetical protein BGW38_007256 [Lunasporangiospora selenospora]|uniref:CBM21 domain-containing protein n=1 Tax=Lunasporangiospora selenospora TaxID=979761 RepID=A0A9P6KAG5_9FUNG|nr:hypothetical protein BGW38_007256 [Lunasporangiospora selenospora]
MPGRITVVQPTINTTLYLKQRIPLHKNGLPIRSAMKAPQPTAVSGVRQARPMNSPLTSPKYVHFNTELEHVRLFLQGETPSCVAGRDTIIDRTDETGSTCDTTIALLNWAAISSASSFQPGDINAGALPLQVENVVLSEDKSELRGTILIHNIAFHKQVFVRYTVDFWRTQTDIPAEFVESITGSAVDRFGFKVPLNMDKTIVEKTFCFAVQYQVVGREFWDSNNGMNYQVECKRVVVTPAATLPTSNSLVGGTKSELSKQMNNILLSSNIPEYTKPIVLKKKKDLGGRYDLSNSLSATYHQTATNGGSYSRDLSSMSPSTGQTAYRPNEYAIPVQSPPGFHRSLYASSPKFVSSYMAMATAAASPPEHFHVDFDQLSMEHSFSKRASRQSWNGHGQETEPMCPPGRPRPVSFPSAVSSSLNNNSPLLRSGSPMSATSAPILIPSGSPIKGSQSSSSYYDFVDRYCFYESSPHSSPYSSPYSSYPNSPPAPCIRG